MAVSPSRLSTESESQSGKIESIDAATGEVLKRFEAARTGELPAIFERARAAQVAWAALAILQRAAFLRRLRDVIYAHREEICGVISRETGKPCIEALLQEALVVIDTADFLARQGPRWLARERVPHHNLALKAKSAWVEYAPRGVIAIISPWNFPFAIPMTETIAALVAGNAVALKPSELTPWTGELVGRMVREAGFPDGLLQILQGGGEIGAAMIEAGPAKVFFTGSVATGRRIAEACARKLIPSVLELGGKDAMIVLDDADLQTASSAAVWGAFNNCGQACIGVKRIYVERGAAEKFTGMCVEKTKRLRLGPPGDPDAEVGPLIRERQLETIEAQLKQAVAEGAEIATGGRRKPELGLSFFEPTIVTRVNHSMAIMREESFGPLLAIQAVESAEEAVALANDSAFGLAASVWTGDGGRGALIASKVRAGSVMVNDLVSYYGICEAPHGGSRESGWGRTHSRLGLLEMADVKYVDVDRLPRVAKSWWFGYSARLLDAARGFVDATFAPKGLRRLRAMAGRRGAAGMVFRGGKI
ncbi:MAG TPA: aldehyde dehydrogenase family protein [Candidatus Acidoferrum sp.]|nr:aldehyde dehydrogenase family protein [Candidatus Acidoferrum sp.]